MRILIVDDEALLRQIVSLHLIRADCRVMEAATAQEALAFAEDGGFDVAIVDYSLGHGWTGVRLIEELRRLHPCSRFILASGWPVEQSDGLDCEFLQKPFTAAQLLSLVRVGEPEAEGTLVASSSF